MALIYPFPYRRSSDLIVQKNPQVPHTNRQVACHPMNNARVKRSSIPPHKTRPDSPVPTLQGLCDPSQIRRIRSQENRSRHYSHLTSEEAEAQRGWVTCPRAHSRCVAQPCILLLPRDLCEQNKLKTPPPEKDLESPSSTCLEARLPYHDSRAMTSSP